MKEETKYYLLVVGAFVAIVFGSPVIFLGAIGWWRFLERVLGI